MYKTKIILFDEPTGNFDIDTESFIKNIIENEFWELTIITLSHRIMSIAEYDRVVILKNGVVRE